MPNRKKSKRARRRRKPSNGGGDEVKRSTNATTGGPSVSRALLVAPPVFGLAPRVTRMFYYEGELSLSATSGLMTGYLFSANGIFDPNVTGTGHQPIAFDQMMQFFEQYVVLKSKISVSFASATASPSRVGIGLFPDTTVPTDYRQFVENGQVVMAPVEGKGEGGSHVIKTLTLTCDVAKYFGKSRRELQSAPDLYGNAAANPTEQVYFLIGHWGGLEAITTVVQFDVTLYYDVFFYEPRKLTIS